MTQLSDLSDDCLMEVLERVSPKQLFKLQRLNKRMKRLAGVKMGVKIKAIQIEDSNRLVPSFSRFTRCSHFDQDLVSPDQVLVLESTINLFMAEINVPSPLVLSLLSKCAGVKSLDFGFLLFPSDLFLEAFQRCSELECVKLAQLLINDDEWDRVLNQIGQRIVHLAITWTTSENMGSFITSDNFLATGAAKCPNIKLIDWVSVDSPTSGLMAAFKLLPNNCWIRLVCSRLAAGVFEDDVDELNCHTLNWSQLGHRYDRLSKLKLNGVYGSSLGVEFNGLKRLEFNENFPSRQLINHLLACRFPLLEEFCFSASAGYSEDDYEGVFQRMTLIKKMVISYGREWMMMAYPKLPQSAAILRLKNLEIIDLIIMKVNSESSFYQQPNDFLQPVDEYVDGIGSLKKLTFNMRHCKNGAWNSAVEELVKRLNLKQSRVEVVLIAK